MYIEFNKKSIQRIISLACLAIIPLYPNIAYALTNSAGISYIFTGLVFSLPIIALISLVRHKWLYSILTSILTVLAIIDLTMVDLYKDYLLPGGIISTLKTNPQEASEFYRTNLREVFHWLPLVLFCIASCFFYQPSSNRKISAYVSLAAMLVVPLFVSYKLFVFYKGQQTLRYYVDNRIWNRPPYNVPFQLLNTHKVLKQRNLINLAQSMHFRACRSDVCSQKEIYVLAIGESLRYDNLSLNGEYPRSTTPRLESIENIVLFDNYYSQACLTMFSVPMLLTRATPTSFELCYSEPSIIVPFQECGFSTYVITNKTNLLSYETYLSNRCDSLIIVPNIVENGEILSGDKTIVHIIDSLAGEHDKLFIICQFLGNHSFYTNYEKEFDVYHPNSNDAGFGYTLEALTNAYDNTILYTDYILSSIIETINRENTCSAMMFMSDHGEGISEGGGGHGGNCSPIIEEYHVPLIFWWNEFYANHFPENISNAKAHKGARICGDNIFSSANAMGGGVCGFSSYGAIGEHFFFRI